VGEEERDSLLDREKIYEEEDSFEKE